MPGKTFVVKGNKNIGRKFSNDRNLVGRNADGTEIIKFRMIGKSRNPSASINIKSLFCEYAKP